MISFSPNTLLLNYAGLQTRQPGLGNNRKTEPAGGRVRVSGHLWGEREEQRECRTLKAAGLECEIQ